MVTPHDGHRAREGHAAQAGWLHHWFANGPWIAWQWIDLRGAAEHDGD